MTYPLGRVKLAKVEAEKAAANFERVVYQAKQHGASFRDIAAAAGCSHHRIQQICERLEVVRHDDPTGGDSTGRPTTPIERIVSKL